MIVLDVGSPMNFGKRCFIAAWSESSEKDIKDRSFCVNDIRSALSEHIQGLEGAFLVSTLYVRPPGT